MVKITNYGKIEGRSFVEYRVSGLNNEQLEFLNENLEEETQIENDTLNLKLYFEDKLYPFQSDAAQFRLDDFVAREEIEMNIFLSGFLEDM